MHWPSDHNVPPILPSITGEAWVAIEQEPEIYQSATIQESTCALKEDTQQNEGTWSCLTGASIFLRQAFITRRRTPDKDSIKVMVKKSSIHRLPFHLSLLYIVVLGWVVGRETTHEKSFV